jgi:four helix bundle protein
METQNHSRTSRGRYFDYERLEVYKSALEYLQLEHLVSREMPRGSAHTRDQLDRAADSIVLNIAEGAGRRKDSRDRARYYDIAGGSAKESGAGWDILRIRKYADEEPCSRARELLLQIVAMLHVMAR